MGFWFAVVGIGSVVAKPIQEYWLSPSKSSGWAWFIWDTSMVEGRAACHKLQEGGTSEGRIRDGERERYGKVNQKRGP